MEMTRKQVEFWSVLLAGMIGVAILVLLIDFQIKGAILEQSTQFRREYESYLRGRIPTSANASGASDVTSDDSAIHPDLLVDDSSRMEAGNASNGAAPTNANTGQRGNSKRRATRAIAPIPSGNE
jgi:hypothetical protein